MESEDGPPPAVVVKRIGESYWGKTRDGNMIEFAQLREHSDGMTAEVKAFTQTGGKYWARVTLVSSRSRHEFARAALRTTGVDWDGYLDLACEEVVRAERTGTPAAALVATRPAPNRWLVPHLFPLGETNTLYGDGGTGKSLLALALAVSGLTGQPLAGLERWRVAPLRAVLYLDWESQSDEHAGRLWALTARRMDPPTTLFYRTMHRPLTEMMPAIQREVAKHHVDLVIVDSMGPACGSEPEGADAATRTMNALHSLPATRLLVAHISKGAAEAGRMSHARPYGSVFLRNLSRACLEAKTADPLVEEDDEEGGLDTSHLVSYRHDKLNSGRLQPTTALRWAYDHEGYITAVPGDVAPAHLGIPQRILQALDGVDKKSARDLAEEIGIAPNAARARLGELESARKVVRFNDSGGGRGRKTLWGRADKKRTDDPA